MFSKAIRNFSSINFNFVSNLPESLQPLQTSIQDFCLQEVKPLAVQADKDNLFPAQLWKSFGQMGLLGLTVPSEFGGSDLNYTAHCIAMEEISRYSGSIGLSFGAHTALCVG
jgi:isovaleryl-CoA dehydrogenase